MTKEVLDIDRTQSKTPLSPVVRANGFLFLSGAPPREAGSSSFAILDIRRQTELVLETIKRRLEAAGSSMDKVVKCTIYITNSAYFDVVNEIYARYFDKDPPARTFVTVGAWPQHFDIEIECIAVA